MNLGLGIYRVLKEIDPDTLKQIRNMEATHFYRKNNIVGAVQTARETFVNIDLPFAVEITTELAETGKGFAVLGPNGEVVSRCSSIAEAENIVKNARVSLVTKVEKDADAAVPA